MLFASYTALTLLLALSIFQIALIFGAPIGHYAWGGKYKRLPQRLRFGSLIAIGVYGIIAVIVLSKIGFIELLSDGFSLTATAWIIFGYLVLGTFANALSRSPHERYTMTPVSFLLAFCMLIVAMG